MTQLYGVTGMPLSGKTTVAEMMKEEGFVVLDMGDIVRIEMDKRGIDPEKTGEFVTGVREEKGMDAVAQLCIPYLEEMMNENERIVITGMRGWSEKKKFEEETGEDMTVVAVWASRETRKQRREKRQREEDLKGQDFHERDLREIENGMAKLIALSDRCIKNDGIGLEELEEKVNKLVS
ncbi:MAG: AAA family ATPase [Candidatus Nanohaloarchaea archaeon]